MKMFENLIGFFMLKNIKMSKISKEDILYSIFILLLFLVCIGLSLVAGKGISILINESKEGVPLVKPDINKAMNYLEANEEKFLFLFPNYAPSNNFIKLCKDTKVRKDTYYLKDNNGNVFKVGYGYNREFELNIDTVKVNDFIEFEECQKLDL
jgi:hypothetical protein